MLRCRRSVPAVLLLALVVAALPAWSGDVTTVILVRHAEKGAEGVDPGLMVNGRERAEELVRVLADVPIDALICSQFRRTLETLEPLGRDRGIEISVEEIRDAEESSRELARKLVERYAGKTVVVAGHSNTVPLLVEALGAGPAPGIDHEQYDDLFVVTVGGDGATVLRLKYGD